MGYKGRPKKEQPRDIVFKVRFNKEEWDQLCYLAGYVYPETMTKSEIIRDLIERESHLAYYGHEKIKERI